MEIEMNGWERRTVAVNGAELVVHQRGHGPAVLMHPSLGRPAEDFEDLGNRVADAGFRSVLINPREIGGSVGRMDGITLHDLAADVWGVADELGIDRAAVLGQNFGNRVARTASADQPDRVTALLLLAAGGEVQPSKEVRDEFAKVFDPSLPPERHLQAVANSFFAAGNDAAVWTDGWYPQAAQDQVKAAERTDFAPLYPGGTAPMAVIQGLDDVIAPPENAWNLVNRRPGARLVAFPNMGHAMLPEHPAAIAAAVIDFLNSVDHNTPR